nr:DNA helicase [Tanacetum cinerariifolium]
HDIWNEGYGTTSVKQQCRRRSLYNGSGLPENDYRHNSANAGRYMAIGTSHTTGYAEGGVILDFADPTRPLLAEKQDSRNVNKFRCEGTRYSRDYTYECLFRQIGSVSTQGESSRNNLGGEKQLRLTFEYLEGCPMVASVVKAVDILASQNNYPSNVDCPGSSLFGDTNSIHINDFENFVVHLPSITGVSTSFQIANDVDMLGSKNNYSSNVNHLGSPFFGDINSIHINGMEIYAVNVAHKPIQISDNVDSRKSHSIKRPPLSNVVHASTLTYVNSNCKGVGSNVNSKRKNTRGREPLPNVISPGVSSCYVDIGDYDCSCQYCEAKFCMTSFGARVEDSINNGRAPYVFKIAGEVYHWIGSLCPNEGDPPSVVDAQEYDFPTLETLGGIVFHNGQDTETDYDVIIQSEGGPPQRINKLHPSYMSLQFPLLFIFGQPGNQQFFIMFMCNVNWPEIKRHMQHYPKVLLGDRADVVVWVFHQKVQHFCKFLKERKLFRAVRGLLYTIEFQKCDLPHCHTLLWIDKKDKIQCVEDIDRYISAEFPDPIEDPEGYRIISEMMIHGPCGPPEPTAPCMKENKCSKKFSKRYNDTTYFDKDGYAHYRGRQTNVYITRNGIDLDNCYTVTFNRKLCLTFHAYTNVEYCGWTMLINYLFKYISKGMERILAQITSPVGEPSSQANRVNIQVEEIQNFVDGRYICPYEAFWRILKFEIHSRQPVVQILSIHLENMQVVTFRDHQSPKAVANNEASKMTTLTEWFEYNKFNIDDRHLTYLDFPKYFVWYADSKVWSPRRCAGQGSISRLAHVHQSACELFYLRILLRHQKDFGLPPFSRRLLEELKNRKLIEERSYNRDELAQEMNILVLKLKADQRRTYDLIMNAIATGQQELIFVYGYGGAEKTFMWKAFINALRSQGKIVLAVASFRIASLLLPNGRITHSRFKLPLELKNESIYMTLKDIMDSPEKLFGGKTVMLRGDFRQTLPVKKGASKLEIIASSIAESHLWSHFKVCILKENMLLLQPGRSEAEQSLACSFASWLLDIGNRKIKEPDCWC